MTTAALATTSRAAPSAARTIAPSNANSLTAGIENTAITTARTPKILPRSFMAPHALWRSPEILPIALVNTHMAPEISAMPPANASIVPIFRVAPYEPAKARAAPRATTTMPRAIAESRALSSPIFFMTTKAVTTPANGTSIPVIYRRPCQPPFLAIAEDIAMTSITPERIAPTISRDVDTSDSAVGSHRLDSAISPTTIEAITPISTTRYANPRPLPRCAPRPASERNAPMAIIREPRITKLLVISSAFMESIIEANATSPYNESTMAANATDRPRKAFMLFPIPAAAPAARVIRLSATTSHPSLPIIS